MSSNITVSQLQSNFAEIQGEFKRVLDGISAGRILQSFEILTKVTDAVVNSCERLGLTAELPLVDSFHPNNFWRALNHCWLVALQSTDKARTQQDALQTEHLVHLRNSVVQWGDVLNKYGLVDYEMGFWESDILESLQNILTKRQDKEKSS